VDPNTNKEYALVGDRTVGGGVFIIDVTNPANPTLVSQAIGVAGFDMKVWGHYLYVVTGSPGTNRGVIFDISNVLDPRSAGAFDSAHNVFIDERGYMYSSQVGTTRDFRIYDLNADPTKPALLWMDAVFKLSGPHDSVVIGKILYDFHGGSTRIYDVTAPNSPWLRSSIENGQFHHSGYPTQDGTHLYITHETARHPQADITVWNIEDLTAPRQVASISDPNATAHNLYIVGDFAFVSYYTAGFRVYDVSDPTQPALVDAYDTAPARTGEEYQGSWGVYPFAPSGSIYVSDMENGLFVFSFTEVPSVLIASFEATYTDGHVKLEWQIGSSQDLQGFHIYRSVGTNGDFQRLNEMMIPAGAEFVYEDSDVETGQSYRYRLSVLDVGNEFFSQTKTVAIPQPSSLVLFQNVPNPFNPSTTLSYEIPTAATVELTVYDTAGKRVRTLVNGFEEAGPHSVEWDARDDRQQPVAAGVYFARLSASGKTDTKRLVFVK
jgi:choice-of-anchor B domain-containing protein